MRKKKPTDLEDGKGRQEGASQADPVNDLGMPLLGKDVPELVGDNGGAGNVAPSLVAKAVGPGSAREEDDGKDGQLFT
jgi:hypothetical protein